MSKLNVEKVPSAEDRSLPIFKEFNDIAEKIRVRAFNLFANRKSDKGNDMDDWLQAEREICWPTAELVEEDDEFEAKVALPGFKPEDIAVTATPRELIIKAARKHEQSGKENDDNVRWSEFKSNNVYRRIALPSDIDVGKVSAELENGMLEIEAPKAKGKARPGRRKKGVKVESE